MDAKLNSNFNAIWQQLSSLKKQKGFSIWSIRKYSKWFGLMKQYRKIVKKIDKWLNLDCLYEIFFLGNLSLLNKYIKQCEYFICQLEKLENTVWEKMQNETDIMNVKVYTLMVVFMAEIYNFRKFYMKKILAELKEQQKYLHNNPRR